MNKPYRTAYVAQNTGHDFTSLLDLASELVFITTGYEDEEQLTATVKKGLADFDPTQDVIVPVGNVFVNLLIGQQISVAHYAVGSFVVALFRDKEYHTRPVWLHRRENNHDGTTKIPTQHA